MDSSNRQMMRRPASSTSNGRRMSNRNNSSKYPVNYGVGAQMNIYGEPEMPSVESVLDNVRYPAASTIGHHMNPYPYGNMYPPHGFTGNTQLGLVTQHMLRKLDESRLLTMTELMKRTYGGPEQQATPYIEEQFSPRDVQYKALPFSPGNGDWKGQIEHIRAHLLQIASEDRTFRKSIANIKLGEITAADLDETGEGFQLTIAFSKHKNDRQRHHSPVSSAHKVESKVKAKIEEEPQYEKENIHQQGTLASARSFNPEADAEVLRKAMKGIGTDEDAVIEIFGRRSSKQRQEVIKMYKTMYGKDLVKDLKGELSGDFWKVVKALCMTPVEYDAVEIRNAIKGLGTNDDTLVEIICTRSPKSIRHMQDVYKKLFGRSLEDDIMDDTSGDYQRLLVSLLQANRDDSNTIDRTLAKKDAKLLYESGARRWGTDESKFNQTLVTRSFPQLRATFHEYEKIAGKTVTEAIKSEMSGNLAEGMLAIVRCVENKAKYFARRLYKSMKGAGTEDNVLVRVVVSRCEVDTVQIMDEFKREYKQSLAQFIVDDTSGDYQKMLVALLGGEVRSKDKRSDRNREKSDRHSDRRHSHSRSGRDYDSDDRE